MDTGKRAKGWRGWQEKRRQEWSLSGGWEEEEEEEEVEDTEEEEDQDFHVKPQNQQKAVSQGCKAEAGGSK